MARRGQIEEDWGDPEDDDWNSDDEVGYDDTEDKEECTILCPYCQEEIHEESLRCPFCENYLSTVDSPAQRRPLWLVVGIVICLILVLMWILLNSLSRSRFV